MGDDGAATRGKMGGKAAKKAVEQAPTIGSTRTPAGEAAGIPQKIHRKLGEISRDQIEAVPGDRLPHVAAIQLNLVAVPQPVQQQGSRSDRRAFDVDTAQRRGAELAYRR